MDYDLQKTPMIREIVDKHIKEAKQSAIRLEDKDNPFGETIVIHETTLRMFLLSMFVEGIENQRDLMLSEGYVLPEKDD